MKIHIDEIKVSIIIPAYNSEKYILETIQSVIDQTWVNKEIIIVDDGSTDSTLQVAKKFESSSIKVIHQKNKGAAAARNTGLAAATGNYIQFLDADDLLSPEKIERQIQILNYHPGYIGLCETVHFFDTDDRATQSVTREWYADGTDEPSDFLIKLYGGGLIGPQYGGMIGLHAWFCPIDIIKKAGIWNEELTVDDDGEFFCRIILASKGIKYSQRAIAYYRKYKNAYSLSAQRSYKHCKKNLLATDLKARYLLAITDSAKAKIALSRLFWENCFNFYPEYKNLANEAESKAKALKPDFYYAPYTTGVKHNLAKIVGWKTVKLLQHIFNKKTSVMKKRFEFTAKDGLQK